MFILSFRLRRGVDAAVFAVCLTFLGFFFLAGDGEAIPVFGVPKPPKCKTNEDRVAYLTSLGWEVAPEPVSQTEVLIPKEFDEIYVKYSQMLQSRGFRLERYKGKTADKYVYQVLNYEGEKGPEEALASLMMRGDTIIGADLSSPRLGGFLQVLAEREPSEK